MLDRAVPGPLRTDIEDEVTAFTSNGPFMHREDFTSRSINTAPVAAPRWAPSTVPPQSPP
ncbi:MAG: hypothetical protein JO345_41315 [Streptosporangiaceae bacterium]|nr:hypothetical protein [Streptosporangiaceae bacterium]